MMHRRVLLGAAGLSWMSGEAISAPAPASACHADRGLLVPVGAVADGSRHPLSTRFQTLQEAKAVYPHASDLSDEIDWCELQACITRAAKQGGGAVYVPNTGSAYVLNRTLTIDPNRVTVHGDGARLHFPELSGEPVAILFRTDSPPMYGHERNVFQGFEVVGPGQTQQFAGIKFQTDVDALSSRAMVRDCAIQQFFNGILFGDRAYGIAFSHVSVFACKFGVHAPYGLKDAGETISFSQCYVFNCMCCISNPGAFDMKFFGCSLDYAQRLFWNNNGAVDLVGCRLEIAPPSVPPVHCSHGRINMFGGFFLINGPREAVHVPELFALSNPDASIHFFSVVGWNWRTTTGRLSNGPGEVHWSEGTTINVAPSSIGHP